MAFELREYQKLAVNAGVSFFQNGNKGNGIIVLPTGAGKSLVIAHIAMALEGNVLILQPSVEILKQNFAKFISYGYSACIYSASAGEKRVGKVTFAMIGSIIKKTHLFKDVKHIIIDECDLCNSKGGMYDTLIKSLPDGRALGLTATPYRLSATFEGAMLKFLTRTNPKIFKKIIYYVQNDVLFNSGHLSSLQYFSFNVIDRRMLKMNSNGTDFNEAALRMYYKKIDMPRHTVNYAHRLLAKRNNLLIFCALIADGEEVVSRIPGSVLLTGSTEPQKRASILTKFKAGEIKCLVNVNCLTVGFDYPELECILIARSTMSMRLYYQMIGRGMRIHESKKDCWIVDLGGNINMFGKIETMQIRQDDIGRHAIWNNGKQLTNVTFQKM